VLSRQPFDSQGIRNRIRIKPLSVVGNDNGRSLSPLTLTLNMNQLVGIQLVPVNNRVAQRLPKRQFNCGLMPGDAARFFDQSHGPVHQRRDSFDLARHPGIDFEVGPIPLYSLEGHSQTQPTDGPPLL